jgi:hypothetical protein
VVALVALLIGVVPTGIAQTAVARLPAAYVDTGAAHVSLAITSWCWDLRCGAPLGHSARRVTVARGALVRVELKLEPVEASVNVGGTHMNATVNGRELSWPATRNGGISAFVRFRRGWVIYSARLALH